MSAPRASSEASFFQSHPDLPIAIVGGGLGGLSLAIGLTKRGIDVHIYEAASQFAEIGAGVTFSSNATRALWLTDPAILEGFKQHATFNEHPELQDTFLTCRWGMDEQGENKAEAGDFVFNIEDKRHSERLKSLGIQTRSVIHRARLLDVLVALLPKDIASFGKKFETVKQHVNGTMELVFADGTTALASAVIGCDGIKSKTREIVCEGVQPKYAGEFAYRALVPRAAAEEALGGELACNGQLYIGYGKYVASYPVERGDYINMVAILQDPDDRLNWNQPDWTVAAGDDDEFLRHLKGFYPPLLDLIKRYRQPFKWGLFDTPHPFPYHKGKLCLLGDSVHATTPHLGAGAGMAIEDAYVLSSLIASARGRVGLETAFYAYDAVRRPRTQQLIEYSRNIGLAGQLSLPGLNDDVERFKEQYEAWGKWLWYEDLEAQVEHAKKLLEEPCSV